MARQKKAPRLMGLRGAKLAPLWEETGVSWLLQVRLRNAVTAATSQTERVPSFSSAQARCYSAHELGAIDLIARECLRRCRDDVAWDDLRPPCDRLRFGLRSVANAAEPLPAFADNPAHVGSL
jgi:hypothetical protein